MAAGCSLPTSDITCVQSWHSLYKSSLLIAFYNSVSWLREAQWLVQGHTAGNDQSRKKTQFWLQNGCYCCLDLRPTWLDNNTLGGFVKFCVGSASMMGGVGVLPSCILPGTSPAVSSHRRLPRRDMAGVTAHAWPAWLGQNPGLASAPWRPAKLLTFQIRELESFARHFFFFFWESDIFLLLLLIICQNVISLLLSLSFPSSLLEWSSLQSRPRSTPLHDLTLC